MPANRSVKSALLALLLVIIALGSWEFYLRHRGFTPDYDDNSELWADKRAMVYEPADKTVVFIGSSRIKYDLDIPTWEATTHTHAIQLSMVGSSPRLFFDDLANDPNFKGRLIVDITEGLYFNNAPFVNLSPGEGISYYHKRTPAQRMSFALDHALEERFVFLNQSFFSLNALLDDLHIRDRPGVHGPYDFPAEFKMTEFSRQNKMTPMFVADTNLQNQVKLVWMGMAKGGGPPPVNGAALDAILQQSKRNVDLIRARGGDVLFIRTPSNERVQPDSLAGYPKSRYWDQLLAVTHCKGIYYTDYPALSHFRCPELSHLKPSDAIIYTQDIIPILENEKGWEFPQNR